MRLPSSKTDILIYFVALDSTDNVTRKTGLSAFTVYRSRNGGTATVYTTPTIAELSASNMPGVYALTIDEDTTIASTSDSEEYCVHITCTTMAPVTRTIELYRRSTTSGKTALIDSNGRVDVAAVAGTAQTARDIGASVLLSSGTGTGQLDITSGVVKANLAQILGTALTETSGQIAAAFKKFFNIATPASTMDALTLVATATNLTNAPTAGDFTATMKSSLNAATPSVTVSDKTGFSLTQSFPANFASLGISAGGHILNVDTLATYTGNTVQTGDAYSRLGAPVGASISADIAAITGGGGGGTAPTAIENADALLDRANGIETGVTPRQAMRLVLATNAGKLSGAGTDTEVIRNAVADTANRIVATVDASGNRSNIVYELG